MKLTKREQIAAMALSGILANRNLTHSPPQANVNKAIDYADLLIQELKAPPSKRFREGKA